MSLIKSIKHNNQAEFFRLLNSNIDNLGKVIDEIDPECGGNALWWASAFGYIHFISPLIKAGINVNKPNNNHETPIWVAAQNEHTAVIIALKAAGANASAPNKNGITPLYVVIKKGNVEAVSALLESGENATINSNWDLVLAEAKRSTQPKRREIVKLLEAHLKQYSASIKLAIRTNKATKISTNSKADPENSSVILQNSSENFSKIRRTSISSEDKKEGWEKTFHILEELRTFFLEEREEGEKAENYAIYNVCLKKTNNDAQLIYKHKQKKHILYINGAPLENSEIAAQEISKMIASWCSKNSPLKTTLQSQESDFKEKFSDIPSKQVEQIAYSERTFQSERAQTLELKNVLESQMQGFKTQLSMLSHFQLGEEKQIVKGKRMADLKTLFESLRQVAEGELEKGEAILKSNRTFNLKPDSFLSKDKLSSLAGFQRAVWILDGQTGRMSKKLVSTGETKL